MLVCCFLHVILTLLTILPGILPLKVVGEPVHHFSAKTPNHNTQISLTKVNNTGVLYGVTSAANNAYDDFGIMYRIDTTRNDTFTVVHQFTNSTGCMPVSSLVFDGGIFLYGSTINCSQFHYGNIFRLNLTDHTLEIIYNFPEESEPSNLLLDKHTGLLYGLTVIGGSAGLGSVFSIDVRHKTPSTTFKQLFSFNSDEIGDLPEDLVLVNDSLYINTNEGTYDAGAIVKMDRNGENVNLIYAFGDNETLGCLPWGQLVSISNEQQQFLYGTTSGDIESCPGTIYRVVLSETSDRIELIATLDDFGFGPLSGLTKSINSSLAYGVLWSGGSHGNGVIFRFNATTGTKLEKVFDFPSDQTFGSYPREGLIELGENIFYGTTSEGGKYDSGTIYKITIE